MLRRISTLALLATSVFALSGCATTHPASNVTRTTADLSGHGTCGVAECTAWIQVESRAPVGAQHAMKIAQTNTGKGSFVGGGKATGLFPGTDYVFQVCGYDRRTPAKVFCFGPDGKVGSYGTFRTKA